MEALLSLVIFLLISSATACDRCVHQSKATFVSSLQALSSGACGYKSEALFFTAGSPVEGTTSLYNNGLGCGACYQIRCKDTRLCTTSGAKVVITDHHGNSQTDFILSPAALLAMARSGMTKQIKDMGFIDIEYKRIPCKYSGKNLSVRVEESSSNPYYLMIKILYQGGQTTIQGVEVAQAGSKNWSSLKRNYGAVWDSNQALTGPLKFRFLVASGGSGTMVYTKEQVLPANWKPGTIYDTGVQITSIAQEKCSPCDTSVWA